jgi:hypothetical protein
VAPSGIRAGLQYHREHKWKVQQQAHIRRLQRRLEEMPSAEMLTRIAALARKHSSVSNVFEQIDMALETDASTGTDMPALSTPSPVDTSHGNT